MRLALLIVDAQQDYLQRPGLTPGAAQLVPMLEKLLTGFRDLALPVFHAQTLIDVDGGNRMPHWVDERRMLCVRGSPGALTPSSLMPRPGEPAIAKSFFSAFGNTELAIALARDGIDTLVIAGLYTHACVRATALDAYQAGMKVLIANDAVASCEPEHAKISLDYLADRGIDNRPVEYLLKELRNRARVIGRSDDVSWQQQDPCNWECILGEVPVRGPAFVDSAVYQALTAHRQWSGFAPEIRLQQLRKWMQALESSRHALVSCLIRDIAKPRRDAEAEVDYGLALLRQGLAQAAVEESTASGTRIRYRPHGVIAAITPWNNPFSLALGKIGPALAYGNTVVWKPALAGSGIASLVMESLHIAGLNHVVQLVSGDAITGSMIATHRDISAVSFTGSCTAGQRLAALCAAQRKPLQAELGGNNPVIVLADVAPESIAGELATAMFSFSGQRCTAPRRIIAEAPIAERLMTALSNSVQKLVIGRPDQPDTNIGPLISRDKRDQLMTNIEAAVRDGGRLLCGGSIPDDYAQGCWMTPTLITDLAAEASLVAEESFGPVAVIQTARNPDDAFTLANAGRHGLVASLYTGSAAHQKQFMETVQAGMLSLNCARPDFDPAAPFGGWRDSGIGMPEHGRWDRDFFTQPQAVYEARTHN